VARDENRKKSAEMSKRGKLYKIPEYSSAELVKQGEAILAKKLAREMLSEVNASFSEGDGVETLGDKWLRNRESYIKELNRSETPSSKTRPKGFLGKGIEALMLTF
jgi:hypothetical protein